MLIIPVNSDADRRVQVLLGDNLLTIRTYWNDLVPAWYMDISDDAGNDIAIGIALVPVINLLKFSPTLTRIYGQFRIVTKDNSENDTETSLGDTALLYWFAPGEAEALETKATTSFVFPFDVYSMYSTTPR